MRCLPGRYRALYNETGYRAISENLSGIVSDLDTVRKGESVEGKTPAESASEMTLMMGPNDANIAGNVHGGVIMRLVDTAAGVAAMRHVQGRVVTAHVDSLSFEAPVHVGDMLTIEAVITQVWRTSMEVEVTVRRENPMTGEGNLTTRAHLTLVGVDENEQPMPVPPLVADTREARARQEAAEVRRAARMRLREEMPEISGAI